MGGLRPRDERGSLSLSSSLVCVLVRTRRYGAKGEHNSVDAQHTCRPHMAVQVLRGAAAGALTCRVLDLP